MDWGGIIAGAMGGGAQAVNQIADNAIQQRDQIEGERRRTMLNREEAAFAADQKLKGEELRMQKYADTMDSVNAKAKKDRTDKDVAGLQLPADQAGPNMGAEEVEAMKPSQRAQYEGAGLIGKRTGSSMAQDRVEAARSIGAMPEVRKELEADYKGEVSNERIAEANAFKEREADRRDKADENRFKATFMQAQASLQRAEADMRRAEKSGDKQALSDAKTSATAAMNAATSAMKEMKESRTIKIDKDGNITGKSPEDVEQYKELKKLLSGATRNLTGKYSESPTPAEKDAPKGSKPPAAQPKSAPPSAIAALKANPGRAKEFDEMFGAGAAKKILGK